MIPVWKLRTLPRTTRLRKITRTLQAAERELEQGKPFDWVYLASCALLVREEATLPSAVREAARALCERSAKGDRGKGLRRALNRLRHGLLEALNEQPAEWDLLLEGGVELDASARAVRPVDIYLEEIRSPFNVGSIFRSAEAFGVRRVLLAPGTASPLHPRAQKTARGAVSALPWRYAPLSALQKREGIVALEIGGTSLQEFRFPAAGVLLVGSEELGLSAPALALAGGGRVSIPMTGAKRSLNVAVAFGIVMQAWAASLSAGF